MVCIMNRDHGQEKGQSSVIFISRRDTLKLENSASTDIMPSCSLSTEGKDRSNQDASWNHLPVSPSRRPRGDRGVCGLDAQGLCLVRGRVRALSLSLYRDRGNINPAAMEVDYT